MHRSRATGANSSISMRTTIARCLGNWNTLKVLATLTKGHKSLSWIQGNAPGIDAQEKFALFRVDGIIDYRAYMILTYFPLNSLWSYIALLAHPFGDNVDLATIPTSNSTWLGSYLALQAIFTNAWNNLLQLDRILYEKEVLGLLCLVKRCGSQHLILRPVKRGKLNETGL